LRLRLDGPWARLWTSRPIAGTFIANLCFRGHKADTELALLVDLDLYGSFGHFGSFECN
jgi:hypothetical protein